MEKNYFYKASFIIIYLLVPIPTLLGKGRKPLKQPGGKMTKMNIKEH